MSATDWVYLNGVHLASTQAQAAFERNFIGYLCAQPDPPHFILVDGGSHYAPGATVIPLDKRSLLSYLRHQLGVYRALRRRYRTHGPFVLYVRSSALMWAPVRFARRYGIRLVIREGPGHYNLLFYYPKLKYIRPLVERYARWIARSADHLIVVTEQIKQTLLTTYAIAPDRITVIPNPAPPVPHGEVTDASASAWPRNWSTNAFVLGYVGSLHQHQGVEDILYGMAQYYRVSDEPPPLRLLLIGDGPDRTRLQQLSSALGLQSVVCFTGRLLQSELAPYYLRMACCVAPYTAAFNRRKGSSALKVSEYLAHDRFVVAADIADYRFLEEQGLGRCYRMEDPVALAVILTELTTRGVPVVDGRAYVARYRAPAVIFERYRRIICG